jgi:hypothetical protein
MRLSETGNNYKMKNQQIQKNPWKRTGCKIKFFLAAFLLLVLFRPCDAQDKVDPSSLIRETQKMLNENHKLTLVWWIPEEFWRTTLAANPDMTTNRVENFLKPLKPYIFVAVVKGEFGTFGGVTYQTETDIRSNLFLFDNQGNQYSPLDNADLNPDVQIFLGMMKPVLANMLGSMGKNFDFYAFPATDKTGKAIANAKTDGSFTVQVAQDKFKWRLPLGSLLPQKICPKCGEKFGGNFKYCPYDGTPLPDPK